MIPWHLVAKAVLPHVADIVSAAGPVFTKRKSGDPASAQPTVLQEQINELQAAAAQNNQYIKELAGQLQTTISALEQGALAADLRVKRAYALCYAASAVSLVSLGLALFAVFGR
jgi:TolA-binding protein